MNIYVGRLNDAITSFHLELLFGHFGEVERVNMIRDRETGGSRHFGFVEMKDPMAAQEAISKLVGARLEGAQLLVKPARDRN
ncbi:MAG: RNA-binding protein [Flavobacteriales bacterium]|nr:RNA-binding protein [Flavobacteriales bacterium]